LPEERQPIFNAPWPALLLTAVIVGSYFLQSTTGSDALIRAFAFSGRDPAEGRWDTLITALFLHAGWAHALMNAAGALAFGTPVARFMGTTARGVLAFVTFYLLCGALSSLGYGMLHPAGGALLIGASGAVSGLMGAAVRMIAGRGAPGPFLSPPVIGMTLAWVAVNLIFAIAGFAPGIGEGAMAWEAHLIGYGAGLVLIDPIGWIAGARRRTEGPWDH
jgi:membrane associated rhomboid family serine protease